MASYLTQEAIASRIEEIVKEQLGTDEALTPETRLQDDLAVDSLERVELGIKLEKAFGIGLSNEKVRDVVTLGDFIQLVMLQVELQQGEAHRV